MIANMVDTQQVVQTLFNAMANTIMFAGLGGSLSFLWWLRKRKVEKADEAKAKAKDLGQVIREATCRSRQSECQGYRDEGCTGCREGIKESLGEIKDSIEDAMETQRKETKDGLELVHSRITQVGKDYKDMNKTFIRHLEHHGEVNAK